MNYIQRNFFGFEQIFYGNIFYYYYKLNVFNSIN